MTLEEALQSLTESDRAFVHARLAVLAAGRGIDFQARSNFYNESRLPENAWRAFCLALLACAPAADEIRRAICLSIRPFTLQGDILGTPRPTVHGRAVTREAFCRKLVDLGHATSLHRARQDVRNLINRPVEVVAERWRDYRLGEYLLWSTFDPSGSLGGPFDGIPKTARAVRGLLGLNPNDRGALLLLEYTLPGGVRPRFPTVADAYAGSEWSYFFRPAGPADPHGLTLPWPEFRGESPRPEVVHEVVLGGQLTAPLRELS